MYVCTPARARVCVCVCMCVHVCVYILVAHTFSHDSNPKIRVLDLVGFVNHSPSTGGLHIGMCRYFLSNYEYNYDAMNSFIMSLILHYLEHARIKRIHNLRNILEHSRYYHFLLTA